ncbi:MAG: spore germination protein [Bacillota bacterium]
MRRFRMHKQISSTYKKVIQEIETDNILSSNVKDGGLSTDIVTNETIFRDIFKNCSDIIFRSVQIHGKTKILLMYVDGLIDSQVLDQAVLKPILFHGLPQGLGEISHIGQMLEDQLIAVAQTKTVLKVEDVVKSVVSANVVILVDGESQALVADMKAWVARSVEEPVTEPVIRGPREGFTETLRTNTSMLRRKIKSPSLKIESLQIGKYTQTDVALAYIEGIVNESVLEEVRRRVQRIQVDSVLESGYIEEFIEDAPFSPFPTVQYSERPDVVASNILEGKVAIFIDGTPSTLIVPYTFFSGLQSAEDYYERFMYASAIRWIRFLLFNIALFLPSFYVAITTFHSEMMPTSLLLSFAASREPSPFPTVVEALMMEIVFEALREAGIRLPKNVGSAVSIVGALVIGEAAVTAGIISAPVVIIVASTGIASFAIPRYNLGIAYRLLRFPLLVFAGIFGLYGIVMGFLAILFHLVSLRSFGVPYLSPLAPLNVKEIKDTLWRAPRWLLNLRPNSLIGGNPIRVPKGQKPDSKR